MGLMMVLLIVFVNISVGPNDTHEMTLKLSIVEMASYIYMYIYNQNGNYTQCLDIVGYILIVDRICLKCKSYQMIICKRG